MRERVFKFALLVALPCASAAALVKWWDLEGFGKLEKGFLSKLVISSAYGSLTFLLSMLTVFRTSQSYARFWDGAEAIYQMGSDFFDVASSVCSFCKMSHAAPALQTSFQHTLIRLFSILHALILAELHGEGRLQDNEVTQHFRIIEYEDLDYETRHTLYESEHKIDCVFQWIQSLLVEGIPSKVLEIPPPVLTRAFQELNNGMSNFHKCLKISRQPFPFPYQAASELILWMHWVVTPLIVGTWTERIEFAFILAFMQVFILWVLHGIASELENPFEGDEHDIDTVMLQEELNSRLLNLLHHTTTRTPSLLEDSTLVAHNLKQKRRSNRQGNLAAVTKVPEVPLLRMNSANDVSAVSSAAALSVGSDGASAKALIVGKAIPSQEAQNGAGLETASSHRLSKETPASSDAEAPGEQQHQQLPPEQQGLQQARQQQPQQRQHDGQTLHQQEVLPEQQAQSEPLPTPPEGQQAQRDRRRPAPSLQQHQQREQRQQDSLQRTGAAPHSPDAVVLEMLAVEEQGTPQGIRRCSTFSI